MPDKFLLEDGTSFLLKEDGKVLLVTASTAQAVGQAFIGPTGTLYAMTVVLSGKRYVGMRINQAVKRAAFY